MKNQYDFYMCREPNYMKEEKDFKLRAFCRIVNDMALSGDKDLGEIESMVNKAWDRHIQLIRFANKKGA